jgi:hypothetical protein
LCAVVDERGVVVGVIFAQIVRSKRGRLAERSRKEQKGETSPALSLSISEKISVEDRIAVEL